MEAGRLQLKGLRRSGTRFPSEVRCLRQKFVRTESRLHAVVGAADVERLRVPQQHVDASTRSGHKGPHHGRGGDESELPRLGETQLDVSEHCQRQLQRPVRSEFRGEPG